MSRTTHQLRGTTMFTLCGRRNLTLALPGEAPVCGKCEAIAAQLAGRMVAPVHELKTHPEAFQAAWEGRKKYEVRRADRPFAVGHRLRLREFSPFVGEHTGRELTVSVTYLTKPGEWGLPPEVCVMGFQVLKRSAR